MCGALASRDYSPKTCSNLIYVEPQKDLDDDAKGAARPAKPQASWLPPMKK